MLVRESTSEWETHDGRTLRARRKVTVPDPPSLGRIRFRGLRPTTSRKAPCNTGLILALGDMQTGKRDGGNSGIRNAASVLRKFAALYDASPTREVSVAWTGDHIEGAVSQGGALAARTLQDLTDQIASVRSLMRESVTMWRSLGVDRLTLAAVPGNHGEAARSGRGPTWTYSDSHDTDALAAVREGVLAHGDPWLQSVRWAIPGVTTPDRDDMTALWGTAGLPVAMHHGHMWRPGKVHDWWRGQAYHSPAMYRARLLLSGHLHHLSIEQDGERLAVQAPATEGESVWYRHRTGSPGSPGGVALRVEDGRVVAILPISA